MPSVHFTITVFIKFIFSQYLLWSFSFKTDTLPRNLVTPTHPLLFKKEALQSWLAVLCEKAGLSWKVMGWKLISFIGGPFSWSGQLLPRKILPPLPGEYIPGCLCSGNWGEEEDWLRSLSLYFILMSESSSSLLLMASIWDPLIESLWRQISFPQMLWGRIHYLVLRRGKGYLRIKLSVTDIWTGLLFLVCLLWIFVCLVFDVVAVFQIVIW